MRPTLLSLAVALAAAAHAADYWVDQAHEQASDQSPGTREQPWSTVGKAAATLEPGDTVTLRPGIYREAVRPKNSGTKGKPITYRAEGHGVVLSGADALTGWKRCTKDDLPGNPHHAKIWVAGTGGAPRALFVDGKPMIPAREPNTGWWTAEAGGTHTLVDTKHLTEPASRWLGATVFFWDVSAGAQGWRPVESFDPKTHTLKLSKPIYADRVVEPGKDRYFVERSLALLDRPGEFAVVSWATSRIFLWPPGDADPNTLLIETPARSRFIIELADRDHLRFEGLEIRHGAGHGIGTWAKGAEGIAITQCYVHDNQATGIYLQNASDVVVRGSLVAGNANGVTCGSTGPLRIEHNEIGHNRFDGLVVAGKSHDVAIRRNYIHDHTLWGHADNIQFFSGVRKVAVEENVILNGGQALMMEQAEQGLIRGNIVAGSEAVAVIHGHRNVHYFRVEGNTIAFTGYGPLSFSGHDCQVRHNILTPGCHTTCMSVSNPEGFTSDHNLFFKPQGLSGPFIAFARNWPSDFAGYREVSRQDAHSVVADPQFVNAPAYCIQIDGRRLFECTASKLIVRGDPRIFEPGDHVEVKFDGIVRRVTSVGADHIVVAPPFAAPPEKAGLILNWKEKEDFALDLRVKPTSPALRAGKDKADIGADLDIQAFRRGDTDGDGKPDVRRAR